MSRHLRRWLAAGLLALCFSPASHAAITVAGTSTAGHLVSGAVSSLSLAKPAGTQAGDVLLAQIVLASSGNFVPAPAGWNSYWIDVRGNVQIFLFYRIAGASEPASYTFGFGSTRALGGLLALRGVDITNPNPIAHTQGNNGTNNPLTALAANVTTANSIVLRYFALDDGNSVLTGPATQRYSLRNTAGKNGAAASASSVIQTTIGSTGIAIATATAGAGGGADAWLAVTVVLKPSVAVSGPHHLEFSHDGSALTCQAETVTLRACANASCSSLYTSPVTATLSPAGWVGGDTQVFTSSTSLQLRHTAVGAVTLGTSAVSPAATSATLCYVGASANCTLNFADSGFIFDVPDLLANKPSGNVDLFAARKDDVSQRCVPAFASGTRTVQFWSGYSNPATGTLSLSVNSTAVAGSSPGTGIALAFDANARATIDVRYADAGQMLLNARLDGTGAEAGLVMTGTDQFLARPAGLCVYSDTAMSDCASGDASCSRFVRAGEPFRLRVKAAAWQLDGDSDFCAGNLSTPNYQQAGIALTSSLIAPAGGAPGSLGLTSADITDPDNGEVLLSNQTEAEVGVFRITATPPAMGYFGTTVTGGTSVNIGRFYPASFLLADPTLVPGCGGYTYAGLPAKAGQGFGYSGRLTARNLAGAQTSNYRGTFVKLASGGFGYSDPGAQGSMTTSSTSLSDPGGAGFGSLDYSANDARFAFNAPHTPYVLGLLTTATDSDGVTGSVTDAPDSAPDNREFRLGRLRLSSVSGPVNQNLAIPATAEHWNGTAYVTNDLDNCSNLDGTTAALSNWQNNLGAGETNTGASTAGTLVNGRSQSVLVLTAPGSNNDGAVDATLPVPSWLLADWTGAGVYANPSATASFGLYRGSDRVIYWKEIP